MCFGNPGLIADWHANLEDAELSVIYGMLRAGINGLEAIAQPELSETGNHRENVGLGESDTALMLGTLISIGVVLVLVLATIILFVVRIIHRLIDHFF